MIKTILDYIGYVTVIWGVVTIFLAIVAWFKGISPALLRLGNGFAKRKIAIFAKSENSSSLVDLLVDSGLFSKNNISVITKENDFGKSENSTLFLVYWPDWKDSVVKIKDLKSDGEALIVYAPKAGGFIPESDMAELDKGRNVTVTNFRGRLLNDVVTALMTTGYIKK